MSNAKVSNELQQRLEYHKPLCRTTLYKHAQTAVLGIYHPTSQHQMLNARNPVSEVKPLVQSPNKHLKRHAWVSNTLMLTAVWTKPSIIPALVLTSVLTLSQWGMDLPQSWHLTLITSTLRGWLTSYYATLLGGQAYLKYYLAEGLKIWYYTALLGTGLLQTLPCWGLDLPQG